MVEDVGFGGLDYEEDAEREVWGELGWSVGFVGGGQTGGDGWYGGIWREGVVR